MWISESIDYAPLTNVPAATVSPVANALVPAEWPNDGGE